jgi:hypothetical protein
MTSDAILRRLGDQLEQAARDDLRPRRRTVVRSLAVAVVVAAFAAGAAVAGGLFSEEEVAQSMPAGSAIFGGTHPSCTLQDDGVTYRCTLASLPTEELLDDHTGAKEPITIDKHIAGGCIGQDSEGRHWNCYLGAEAVKRAIVSQGFLGEYAPAPGRG